MAYRPKTDWYYKVRLLDLEQGNEPGGYRETVLYVRLNRPLSRVLADYAGLKHDQLDREITEILSPEQFQETGLDEAAVQDGLYCAHCGFGMQLGMCDGCSPSRHSEVVSLSPQWTFGDPPIELPGQIRTWLVSRDYAFDAAVPRGEVPYEGAAINVVGFGPLPLPGERRRHHEAEQQARRLLGLAAEAAGRSEESH